MREGMGANPDSTVAVQSANRQTRRNPEAGLAQLVVLTGRFAGTRLPIEDEVVVGRAQDASAHIDDDGISRRHCRIGRIPGGGFEIEDLGSRNGTFINGLQTKHTILSFGDKIAIGSGTVLLFARRDPLEERLRQAQKLQVLGELASGIAHDFNNLLSALLSSVGFLRDAELPEDPSVIQCLDDMDLAARRAMDLAGQLTAFAQTSKRERSPVDLSRLVNDASRLIQRIIPRSVEMQIRTRPDIGTRGDTAQLLQVLMNLCVNAADAMPEGGVLEVQTGVARPDPRVLAEYPHLAQGDFVSLVVTDNGVGMDPQTVSRVFEPFFTTKGRGQGTGLGLSTAYRVVREHGGEIVVRSIPGEGTEFAVYLPAANLEVESTGVYAPVTIGQSELTGLVLLVEDEALVRSSVARVLERAGARVLVASDGAQAVECFGNHAGEINLVVLDLDIPKIPGDEVLHAIRTLRPDLSVLVSSGFVDAQREDALVSAGVQGFLHKPYDSGELLAAVAEHLQPR